MTTVFSPFRWMECRFVALEELKAQDTSDELLPIIDNEKLAVAFMNTGVFRECTPSRRFNVTHFPGHWPEERLRRTSSRDWQAGYEDAEHLAEACRDTHESCVVTRTAARKTISRKDTSNPISSVYVR